MSQCPGAHAAQNLGHRIGAVLDGIGVTSASGTPAGSIGQIPTTTAEVEVPPSGEVISSP